MAFNEDLSVFMRVTEFADSAQWGSLTASVIADAPTEDILGGGAQSDQYSFMMPTTSFPGIKFGDQFTVSTGRLAGTYRVRSAERMEDAAFKTILATKL